MSELRLDPLTGRWVVISTERADRAHAFLSKRLPVEDDPARPCPFCPGGDDAENALFDADGRDGNWRVRVVANRYPAFGGSDSMLVTHLGPAFIKASAPGSHEVFLLTPEHDSSWADLSDEHAAQLMEVLRSRMEVHASDPGLRYSQAVVNCGREAGASIEHPHGQMLSLPFIPGETAAEMAGFARFQGNCLMCTTAEAEIGAGHRVLYLDDQVAVICPFWSGTPYEIMIIPLRHGPHLYRASEDELAAVGTTIRTALRALRERLGEIAYNLMFHSAPYRVSGDYHWHVHVLPKVTTRGGFELGSGVLINVVSPEAAASELRSVAALS